MGPAFAAAFAACVLMPWVGGAQGSEELVFLSPVLWGAVFLTGVGVAVAGGVRESAALKSIGAGLMLGAAVGAIVGFSLCAGTISLGPMN